MKAEQHFREAAYWIAKAPPFAAACAAQPARQAVVIRFPVERVRRGRGATKGGQGE